MYLYFMLLYFFVCHHRLLLPERNTQVIAFDLFFPLTVSNAINSIDARRASFLSFFLSFSFDNHHAVIRFLTRRRPTFIQGRKNSISREYSRFTTFTYAIYVTICIIYIYITVSAIKALVSFFLISSPSFFSILFLYVYKETNTLDNNYVKRA